MFKVQVKGLAGLKQQFASSSKKLEEIVGQEMESMAEDFVARAVKDAPVDEARLKASIGYSGSGLTYEVFAGVYYAPYMEFGTKGRYQAIPGTEAIAAQFKGSRGGSFKDLLIAIVRWVARKGISGTYSVKTRRRTGNKLNRYAEDYSAAWPIALSILRNGVRPHPFFFKQQEIVWPEMVRKVTARLERDTKVSVILPGDIKRPKITTV